jgi:hypothetical protein
MTHTLIWATPERARRRADEVEPSSQRAVTTLIAGYDSPAHITIVRRQLDAGAPSRRMKEAREDDGQMTVHEVTCHLLHRLELTTVFGIGRDPPLPSGAPSVHPEAGTHSVPAARNDVCQSIDEGGVYADA